jgi:hypothetical protein
MSAFFAMLDFWDYVTFECLAIVAAGAHGAAAIYAWPGGFTYLRRIVIRTYTWLNWLQPLPF